MREIRFVAKFVMYGHITEHFVKTLPPFHKCQGYIMRKVKDHPFANKRGYVQEHRLVMEEKLGRFLKPQQEFVHHIDQDRSNNVISNLQLQGSQNWHAKGHLPGKRNNHGQFVCKEPIFNEIKFRLKNTNTGLTTIYTLNQLIATTFRKGQFEFRGRFTGLKDKKDRKIYEGDIVKNHWYNCYGEFIGNNWEVKFGEHQTSEDYYASGAYGFYYQNCKGEEEALSSLPSDNDKGIEIIGNIYEHSHLLKDK